MTLERARQLILSEEMREHGQNSVDQLIAELDLGRVFGFKAGTRFSGGLAL